MCDAGMKDNCRLWWQDNDAKLTVPINPASCCSSACARRVICAVGQRAWECRRSDQQNLLDEVIHSRHTTACSNAATYGEAGVPIALQLPLTTLSAWSSLAFWSRPTLCIRPTG